MLACARDTRDDGVVSSLLTTERLELRTWRPDETGRLFDVRRRTETARWLGDPTPWTDPTTADKKIAEWAEEVAADDPFGVWAIIERTVDVPAGSVSLHRLPDDDEVEIGWYLHPDASGRGLAADAAGALLDHAHAQGIARVWAIMWAENHRSAAVARAIGMTDLGVRDDPWYGTDECAVSQMFLSDRASRTF